MAIIVRADKKKILSVPCRQVTSPSCVWDKSAEYLPQRPGKPAALREHIFVLELDDEYTPRLVVVEASKLQDAAIDNMFIKIGSP